MRTIYLCEDDLTLGEAISDLLIIDGGFRVKRAFDGSELREFLAESAPDLLILDIQLPGETGFEIAESVGPLIPNVPMMFLSAFSGLENRLAAAHAGGLTFLAKPFEPEELLAVAKRLTHFGAVGHGAGTIKNKELNCGSESIKLTDREVQLLRFLALVGESGGEYHVLMEVIGIDFDDRGVANLEVAISRLRKKLREAQSPSVISNRTGFGYSLSNPPIFL